MFIVDRIIEEDGSIKDDVLGGAGLYAAVGARVFAEADQVGFIVDYGSDATTEMRSTIDAFEFDLRVREDATRFCTRGLNTYKDGVRAFSYLTPKIRITPADLDDRLVCSASIHLICSPLRCIAILDELDARRRLLGHDGMQTIVWEPVPDACFHTPEQWQAFKDAMGRVSVTSPNAYELYGILGISPPPEEEHTVEALSALTRQLAQHCTGVVVRAAHLGCLHVEAGILSHTPAYYGAQQSCCVLDTTGAGNAFCGALAVAMAHGHKLGEAVLRASIAAALAVEQTGLPTMTKTDGQAIWNGKDVMKMLSSFSDRLKLGGDV